MEFNLLRGSYCFLSAANKIVILVSDTYFVGSSVFIVSFINLRLSETMVLKNLKRKYNMDMSCVYFFSNIYWRLNPSAQCGVMSFI